METEYITDLISVSEKRPKPVIHENMTFNEILVAFDYNDNCFEKDEELSEADIRLLINLIPKKLDGCALWFNKQTDDAKRASDFSKKFAEYSKQITMRQEKFLGYMKQALESNGFEKMPGEAFVVSLKKNPPSIVTTRQPTADEAMLLEKYVRTTITHEWRKPEIKEALKAGEVLDFAEIKQETKAVFGIKKG